MKSNVRKLLSSKPNVTVGSVCLLALATYPILHTHLSEELPGMSILRLISQLSECAAAWATVRALSARIPQMGKPYYSDDGTLSAMMTSKPRDLSIPWTEVILIMVELLIFTALYLFLILRRLL